MIDGFWYGLVAVLGALVGSFLNVCIYRLPRSESIVWPGSHCPSCGASIAWYDNIPVMSYLRLLGRCAKCRAPISLRYPLVEAANAAGYVLILAAFGMNWTAVLYGVLFSALLVVTGTDLTHYMIPNAITLPGIILGLIGAATVLPVGLFDASLGVLIGGGIIWFLVWVSPYIFGKEGMGRGDVKLVAMIGAFLGWKPALLTIMIGSLAGSLISLALIVLGFMKREDYIPFGPYLVFGALVSLFFGHPLVDWYMRLLSPSL